MKKLYAVLAGCSALVFSQAAAAHGHFDPYVTRAAVPADPWVIQGNATVSKDLTLNCDFTLTLVGSEDNGDTGGPGVSHTDIHHLDATLVLTGSGGLCDTVIIDPISDPNVEYSGSSNVGTITLKNVYAHTISLGDCTGNINIAWNAGNVTFNQTLPPATAGSACTLAGAGTETSLPSRQILP